MVSSRDFRRRQIATVAVVAAGLAFVAPAVASAQPSTFGSSTGSSLIDDPIGTLSEGARILGEAIGGFGGSDLGSSGPGTPTQNCNEQTVSGGEGVTDTNHQLGRTGPTSFVLDYETESVPDNIEVFYQGGKVYESGYIGDDLNEGTGSAVVSLPPGGATTVLVRVTGPSGTSWAYTVRC
ncbi:hypothetical protein RU01_02320 [Rhodococcus sp. MEB064]|nr:hypothetical protein RU01_02320 [Rhodococcus sp. MEB064]